jgi:hypothetical protein
MSLIVGLSVAFVAVGCGQSSTPHVRAGESQVDYQGQLDSLYVAISGTADERRAGDSVSYHIEEDPVTACMKNAGVSYTPAPFVDQWQDWPQTGSGSFATHWLAPLNGLDRLAAVAQEEAQAERSVAADQLAANQAYQALSPDDRKNWDAAIASCPEGANYDEAWHPDKYYDLLGGFRAMVDQVDVSLDDTYGAEYKSCMGGFGFDAVNFDDLVSQLRSQLPTSTQIPPPGTKGGQDWQSWLTKESAAQAADSNCRAAAHDAGWSVLGPQIGDFNTQNSGALAQEAAGWAAIVAEAPRPPVRK